MYTATSRTITNTLTDNFLKWTFQIENGQSGEKVITNKFITNSDLAEQRAMSEFLQNSYRERTVGISTWRTDFNLNQNIKVLGVYYLIKSLSTDISERSMITKINGVRYEF